MDGRDKPGHDEADKVGSNVIGLRRILAQPLRSTHSASCELFGSKQESCVVALASFEDADGIRCVDLLQHDDGTFFFQEFRRDPEDAGRWTLIGDYSDLRFPTRDQALEAAEARLDWFTRKRQGDNTYRPRQATP